MDRKPKPFIYRTTTSTFDEWGVLVIGRVVIPIITIPIIYGTLCILVPLTVLLISRSGMDAVGTLVLMILLALALALLVLAVWGLATIVRMFRIAYKEERER